MRTLEQVVITAIPQTETTTSLDEQIDAVHAKSIAEIIKMLPESARESARSCLADIVVRAMEKGWRAGIRYAIEIAKDVR